MANGTSADLTLLGIVLVGGVGAYLDVRYVATA